MVGSHLIFRPHTILWTHLIVIHILCPDKDYQVSITFYLFPQKKIMRPDFHTKKWSFSWHFLLICIVTHHHWRWSDHPSFKKLGLLTLFLGIIIIAIFFIFYTKKQKPFGEKTFSRFFVYVSFTSKSEREFLQSFWSSFSSTGYQMNSYF